VALFGLVALGDRVTGAGALAILVATAGVILMSWPARSAKPLAAGEAAGWRPAMLGLGAAGCFALSSVGFRAGILAMGARPFSARPRPYSWPPFHPIDADCRASRDL